MQEFSNLLNALPEVLKTWPLYRILEFSGDVTFDYGGTPVFSVPGEITTMCSVCDHDQQWRLEDTDEVHGDEVYILSGFIVLRYRCKNCGSAWRHFCLIIDINTSGGKIVKVGQYPPLDKEPDRLLASAMDKADLALYRKALTCRNSNFGIAAVAYLRRIVENSTNYLLDLIAGRLRIEEPDSRLLVELGEIKAGKRFSDKIDFAARMLPRSLGRSGQNPIATLHDLTSEGLHGKSDDECVEIFDRCQLAFEHVVRRLKEDKDEDERYEAALKKLNEKKTIKRKE